MNYLYIYVVIYKNIYLETMSNGNYMRFKLLLQISIHINLIMTPPKFYDTLLLQTF